MLKAFEVLLARLIGIFYYDQTHSGLIVGLLHPLTSVHIDSEASCLCCPVGLSHTITTTTVSVLVPN